jgi:hypothetical protein
VSPAAPFNSEGVSGKRIGSSRCAPIVAQSSPRHLAISCAASFRDSNPKKVQPVIDRSGFAIHNLHGKKFLPIHTRIHFLLGEAPSTELRILERI